MNSLHFVEGYFTHFYDVCGVSLKDGSTSQSVHYRHIQFSINGLEAANGSRSIMLIVDVSFEDVERGTSKTANVRSPPKAAAQNTKNPP